MLNWVVTINFGTLTDKSHGDIFSLFKEWLKDIDPDAEVSVTLTGGGM